MDKRLWAIGVLAIAVAVPVCVPGQGRTGDDAVVAGGVVRFHGVIASPTCVINGGNGGEHFMVNLPTVSASHFAARGATAGQTRFTITLSGCGGAGTHVRANFHKDAMVDAASGRLLVNQHDAHAAKNIQVELAGADGAPVVIGGSQQATGYFPIDRHGNAELVYLVRYYATGKVTPGQVDSQVTYVLEYQ